MIILNKKALLILISLAALSGFTVWFYQYRQTNQQTQETQQKINSQIKEAQTQQSTTTASIFKTYHNEEWGFEFQYPKDWIFKENIFKNYYSKFNMELWVLIGEKHDESFLVNIVLPEFTRGFNGLEKNTSEIIVAGVQGVKYEYQFEGFPETAVILPFGEYKIILGTGGGSKQYLDEFNQILASFKFLK